VNGMLFHRSSYVVVIVINSAWLHLARWTYQQFCTL